MDSTVLEFDLKPHITGGNIVIYIRYSQRYTEFIFTIESKGECVSQIWLRTKWNDMNILATKMPCMYISSIHYGLPHQK